MRTTLLPVLLFAAVLSLCACPPPPRMDTTTAIGAVSFTIESEPPGADVTVDNVPMGTTPATVKLAAGAHHLKLNKSGCFPMETEVGVAAGGSFKGKLVASH